jgi:hypothetical protein
MMIISALLLATAQTAAPAPATAPAAAATAPASRLNLDTPVEAIMADAKGKTVIDANLPQLAGHPSYDMFKGMSLRQLQSYAADQLTDPVLAKVGTELAAVK